MSNKALLLIDVQRNMLFPPEPVPDAPTLHRAITRILEQARRSGSLVVHVRNNGDEDDPDAPGSPGWELVHEVRGDEAVVDKRTPDSFADTELDKLLTDISCAIIVGAQSEFCVRETSLAALQRGISVELVQQAHGTHAGVKRTSTEIATAIEEELSRAGARIIDIDDVTF